MQAAYRCQAQFLKREETGTKVKESKRLGERGKKGSRRQGWWEGGSRMVGKGGRQLSAGQTSASEVLVGMTWKGGVREL